jgi:hypothetical protein
MPEDHRRLHEEVGGIPFILPGRNVGGEAERVVDGQLGVESQIEEGGEEDDDQRLCQEGPSGGPEPDAARGLGGYQQIPR